MSDLEAEVDIDGESAEKDGEDSNASEGGASESDGVASASDDGGVGKKKTKTNEKITKKEAANRGKYAKSKSGEKQCTGCGKWLLLDKFPPGSAKCHADKKALQNIQRCEGAE